MIFCSTSSSLHARDSLHDHQILRMLIAQNACSTNSWLDDSQISWWCLCICLRSLIEINCLNSLSDMCLVRNRILVTEYSYEYIKDSILTKNNRIDWFFEPEMLETIYDKKILHCKMPRSNLIDIFTCCCIESSFTKPADSNQFLKILVQKTSAIASVREWYSYEANVNDLNWLLFKITASWL